MALFFSISPLAFAQQVINPSEKLDRSIFGDSLAATEKAIDSTADKRTFKLIKKIGHASYYADKFNGRRTASGRVFSNAKYTAAHRKLPFGTVVRVTNEVNGKSVVVEINDRGPFVKSRDIDLSKKAFMDITHRKGAGVLAVTIEEVLPAKVKAKP